MRNRKKIYTDFQDQKEENLKKQLHLKQDQMVDKVQVIIREQHQALDKALAVIKEQHQVLDLAVIKEQHQALDLAVIKEQHQAHQIVIKMLLKLLIVPKLLQMETRENINSLDQKKGD